MSIDSVNATPSTIPDALNRASFDSKGRKWWPFGTVSDILGLHVDHIKGISYKLVESQPQFEDELFYDETDIFGTQGFYWALTGQLLVVSSNGDDVMRYFLEDHSAENVAQTVSVPAVREVTSDESPFDRLCKVREDGSEFWSARDLSEVLGYTEWRNFNAAIKRASLSIKNQNIPLNSHVVDVNALVQRPQGGSFRQSDYEMSRFAAYLVAMNGDPRKSEVAAAQAYFAVKTREAEVQEATPQLQIPTNMAEALRMAANEHERAELEKQERLALEAKREEDAPWVAKAQGMSAPSSWMHKQEFARKVQACGLEHGLRIKQQNVFKLLSQHGMTVKEGRTDTGLMTAQGIKNGWGKDDHGVTSKGHAIVTMRMSAKGQDIAWKWVHRAIREYGEDLVAKEVGL